MDKFKVVITDREYDSIENEIKILEAAGAVVFAYREREEDKLIDLVRYCDAIIVQYAKIPRKIIEVLENCKSISKYAIGDDGIDLEAATEKGICVSNVPDYCVDEVSTHAVGLLLDITRKITLLNNAVKEGVWNYKLSKPIYSLKDKKLGLVGFGKIPKEVARKVAPFGIAVLTYDPYISDEAAKEYGVTKVSLEELLESSDVISAHVPLTEETRHMFNLDLFKKMKPEAYFINVGRGPLVNEADLAEALAKKIIAGAALDVTEIEPIQRDNPLLAFDNIIITPHQAWYSEESEIRLQSGAAEEVARVLSGYYPKSLVNPKVKDIVKLNEIL